MSAQNSTTELGELLRSTVTAIVGVQGGLDADALARTKSWLDEQDGSLVPPPLWFTCRSASIELELASRVVRETVEGRPTPRLLCRTVDPTTATLFGLDASTSTRVRLLIDLHGPVIPKEPA
jgi:hypothetical protein